MNSNILLFIFSTHTFLRSCNSLKNKFATNYSNGNFSTFVTDFNKGKKKNTPNPQKMQTKGGEKKNHRNPNPRAHKWVSWEQYFAMLTYVSTKCDQTIMVSV